MQDTDDIAVGPRRGTRERQGARDRLQPALLDRLLDDAPQRRSEAPEAATLSHQALRLAVLRDLRWLLNTINLESESSLAAYPGVRSSTLNFGLPPLAGKRMSEIDWADVEASLRDALVHFEPRILRDSIHVVCVTDAGTLAHHNILSLQIRGMLWAVPFPREFLFRTDIDLESGHMDLSDLGGV